jgi:hypothetical protein
MLKRRSKKAKYAVGGVAGEMNELLAEGGMMDNSGEVVNGTEVPAGSLREEVADDVPAMLSEGEFVVPADVVRYVGLEKLMKMRDQAKAGLERMEEMGQMGNAEEVSNPDQQFSQVDDIAFENDIDSIMGEVDREGAAMQTQQMFAAGGFVSGSDLSKAVQNPAVDVRYYKHDDGRVMYITHINDKPMTAIPDGFKEVAAEEVRQVGKKAEETAAAGGATGGGAVSGGGDGGGDYDGGFPTASSTGTTGKGITDPMAPFGTYSQMNVTTPSLASVAKGILGVATTGTPVNPLTLQALKEVFFDKRTQTMVNPAYSMAMQQSAQAVASGAASLSGSPFGSMAEAQAVAQHGHMSDQHFQSVIDTVNSQLSPANTSGFSMDTAASTGMATNAAGQTVSNDATIAAQNEAMFGDTGGSFAPSANVGAQEGFDGSPGVSGPAAVGPSGGISEGFDGSPSAPSANEGAQEGFDGSPGDGGGGGGGCVIATHAVNSGVFTPKEKRRAELWCMQQLHNKWWGESIRRGYRYYGQKAINEGKAEQRYQEFRDFVDFGTGKRRNLKTAYTFVWRTVQFFFTGLFLKK